MAVKENIGINPRIRELLTKENVQSFEVLEDAELEDSDECAWVTERLKTVCKKRDGKNCEPGHRCKAIAVKVRQSDGTFKTKVICMCA